MSKKDLIKLGSDTAKGGFRNEDDIVAKFNNWKNDEDAKKWLEIMGYPIDEIVGDLKKILPKKNKQENKRKNKRLYCFCIGRKRCSDNKW